jgi:uncharacterized membrane protein YeaQ/YmgE (transglycosylase-associated protein family)
MSWVAWIIVGIVAGVIAKWVMPGTKDEPNGVLGTMLMGIIGAVVGGWIYNLVLNQPGASGVNLYSIVVALIGACVVIGLMRVLSRVGTPNY